jgi:hypothetical protein
VAAAEGAHDREAGRVKTKDTGQLSCHGDGPQHLN